MKKGRPILTALCSLAFGFFIGISFPVEITPKLQCGMMFPCTNSSSGDSYMVLMGRIWAPFRNITDLPNANATSDSGSGSEKVIHVRKGAEKLPPGIVVSESDLHMRRLWGAPREDSPARKNLLAISVGYKEKAVINATVHKFLEEEGEFDVVLFHYDGRASEWDGEFEWSRKQVVHVNAKGQSKWWFAKRFLHPAVVAPYEYIFLWDEDLGVDNFAAGEYLGIVRKHGLEISQPALDTTRGNKTYDHTQRRAGGEFHTGGPGNCPGFVEVMAPVFSRDAWTCVWHLMQNDLVHAWGLDWNFWRCVDRPGEQIGVVDTQYVVHGGLPTLKGQGSVEQEGGAEKVKGRQWEEWNIFGGRLDKADKELANSTAAAAADHRP